MHTLSSFYQTLNSPGRSRSRDDIYLVLYDGIYDQCVHTASSEPCIHTPDSDDCEGHKVNDKHVYYGNISFDLL